MRRSRLGDMTDMCERVGTLVTSFTEFVRNTALDARLAPFAPDMPLTARLEQATSEMVNMSNLAVETEFQLSQIMVLCQFLDVEWTKIETKALERFSRTEAHRYMPTGAKLASVIEANKELWETLRHAKAAVEVGKRAVERVERLEKVASRAAGILMG